MKSFVKRAGIFATIVAGAALAGCGQNSPTPTEKPANLTPAAPAPEPGK